MPRKATDFSLTVYAGAVSISGQRVGYIRVSTGEQKAALARTFGISRETLYQYLKRAGLSIWSINRKPDRLEDACQERIVSPRWLWLVLTAPIGLTS